MTEAGIQIDESDEQPENAPYAIHEMFDPASNDAVESDKQPEKQH
jgi:hypothetical protein